MNNKVDEPPPSYTTSRQGFDQSPKQSQYGGQINYGYSLNMPQETPYMAEYASLNNGVVTQVPGNAGIIYQPAPRDYSTQAWIACLCCFWPTGVLAIMKAYESRDALTRGDMAGAHAAANCAQTLVRISWALGMLSIVVSALALGFNYGVGFS